MGVDFVLREDPEQVLKFVKMNESQRSYYSTLTKSVSKNSTMSAADQFEVEKIKIHVQRPSMDPISPASGFTGN